MTQAKSEKKPNKIIKNDAYNEQTPETNSQMKAPEEKSENPNEGVNE